MNPIDSPACPSLSPNTRRRATRRVSLRRTGGGAPFLARSGGRLLSVLASLSAVLAAGALSASPALAAQARVFEGAFGCAEGAPGCTVPDPYPLAEPGGVAVDERTGDVYVASMAVDDVQSVTVQGATGGKFKLFFEDPVTHEVKATAPIVFRDEVGFAVSKATDEEIRAALEAAGAGAGNVRVTGENNHDEHAGNEIRGNYRVRFVGALTGVAVKTMTADVTGLTGAGAAVVLATTESALPGDDVQKFNETGELIAVFGKDVNRTKVEGVASEAERDVCVVEPGVVCQGGQEGTTPGAYVFGRSGEGPESGVTLEFGAFVGVDPSTGDVYVADGGDGLVTKLTEAGGVVSSWGDNGPGESADGQLVGPKGHGTEHFGLLFSGVAVDSAGDLWVDSGGEQRLSEFDRSGTLVTAWPVILNERGTLVHFYNERFGIAVDSEDDLYLVHETGGGGEDFKFTAAGAFVGQITERYGATGETPEEGAGVAVDAGGVFYRALVQRVVEENGSVVAVEKGIQAFAGCHPHGFGLEGLCAQTELFAVKHPPGPSSLAVDSAVAGDTVYAAGQSIRQVLAFSRVTVPTVVTLKPSAVGGGSATLAGSVNPSGVGLTHCFFEYGETEAYGHVVPCAESVAQIGSGSGAVEVHAAIAVQPGGLDHYRLVADNLDDEQEPVQGADLVLGPPLIESESSVEVGALTASLQAQVDPQSVDTRVRVQYGASTEYGSETGEVDIGAGSTAQSVPVALEGLAPSTTYHYRFVAENALGEGAGAILGPDRAFTTQGAGSFRLADARGWELVSPRAPHGASIEALTSSYDTGGATQAAAAGSAVSYVTNVPVQSDVQGYPEFAQVLSTRGPSGWVSRDLSVPHSASVPTTTSVTYGREYRYFSEDLSHAVLQPQGQFEPCTSTLGAPEPCLSPQASEQTAFVQDLHTGLFTPLASGCPSPAVEEEGHPCPAAVAEHADVPPGTVFGQASVLAQ